MYRASKHSNLQHAQLAADDWSRQGATALVVQRGGASEWEVWVTAVDALAVYHVGAVVRLGGPY